jgi:hypothetical protein
MDDRLRNPKNWYLVLDADADARERERCACRSCLREYVAASQVAADDVLEELVADGILPAGTSLTVLLGRYGEPLGEDPAADIEDALPGTWVRISSKAEADWARIAARCRCPACAADSAPT